MTQYQNPYNLPPPAPGYCYYPQPDLLAPARYASIFTFCVGGLILLGGVCMGLLGWLSTGELMDQMMQGAGDSSVTPEMLRLGLISMGVIAVVVSLAMIILAIFVWRGSVAAIIATIVLVSLALLLGIFNSLASLQNARGLGGPHLMAVGCVAVLIPLVLGALVAMLVAALKSARRARNALWQQQAQYWQYQQQQYAYGQPGYGYAQPPPMPALPTTTPSGEADDENRPH